MTKVDRKTTKGLLGLDGLWLDRFARETEADSFSPGRAEMKRERLQVFYSGRVQGVGFRYSVKSLVMGFEVTGFVRNLDDGRVELMAEGTRNELEEFQTAIRNSGVGRFIRGEQVSWKEAAGEFRGFEILS